ncbi:MAG: hypothetical protein PHV33_08655 [Elusimicrobiales bacterium]|nr:hypothetical protein [Elusimicrobiales bacterium]
MEKLDSARSLFNLKASFVIGAGAATNWSRIGFRLAGVDWIGDKAGDGMWFEVRTHSIDFLPPPAR